MDAVTLPGRWQQYRPPLPKIYTPASCALEGASPAGCDTARCMQRPQLIKAKHNSTYADQLCDQCECSLCLICAKLVNRWTTPTGQYLESVTTRTRPPFTFAFKPDDDDMSRMRQQLILEPTLTHAWHEATWRCCQAHGGNGIIVDVGGNFGWYTLYSLALGCRVVVFEPIPAYQEVMMLGVSLNPGFRERLELHRNVVYDTPGWAHQRAHSVSPHSSEPLSIWHPLISPPPLSLLLSPPLSSALLLSPPLSSSDTLPSCLSIVRLLSKLAATTRCASQSRAAATVKSSA